MEQQVWSVGNMPDNQPCDLVSQIRLRRDNWVSVRYAEELHASHEFSHPSEH